MISCWEKFGKSKRLSFTFHHQFTFYLRITEQMAVVCVFSVFIKKFTNARDEKWIWHVDPWGMSNIIFRQIFTHSLKQVVWQCAKEKMFNAWNHLHPLYRVMNSKGQNKFSINFWIYVDQYHPVINFLTKVFWAFCINNHYLAMLEKNAPIFPNQFRSKQRLFL